MAKRNTKNILIAVAWPYVNGNIHVGHLAGYLLPADVFARYMRLRGHDVLMVSGSDCHGTPITVAADKEDVSPEEIIDKYHPKDLDLWEKYDLTFNLYTKTTTDNHRKVSQGIFLDLLTNEYIVKDTMQQYYSPKDGKFLPDRYVEGICPHCDAKEQRSDQCENCGRWLKDGELIDPVSKMTGEKVELRDTEHYFLDFPKLENELKKFVNDAGRPDIWRNWVHKETKGWLEEGMQKRAITRDMDWSMPLPIDEIREKHQDKLIEEIESKRIYVWFEAVIGYLSAPQEWAQIVSGKSAEDKDEDRNGGYFYERNDDYILRIYKGQSRDWEHWWKNPKSEHYYFIGQDNLVFHTLMWPGQLIGVNHNHKEGDKYTLPHNVVVNKFMNFNDAKFSKSRGNVVDSMEIAEQYGVDPVRYFILSNLPENKESNFTWDRFTEAVNNELVANLGNLVNRVLILTERNIGKEISIDAKNMGNEDLAKQISDTYKKVSAALESQNFVEALKYIMELSSAGNLLLNQEEPWKLFKASKKDDQEKAKQVMIDLLNLIEHLAKLITPFLPQSSEKMLDMLDLESSDVEVGKDLWGSEVSFRNTYTLQHIAPLFSKIELEENID